MDTTLPPFTPHHVRLVGQDLGPVPARYVGCWLEIDHPEHGGRYGPSAVFRAVPVAAEAKASRGALVWLNVSGIWNLCQPCAVSLAEAPYTAAFQWAHSYLRLGAPMERKYKCPNSVAAIAQITTWAREDGYEVPPWPGEAKVEAVPAPAPKDRTVYDPDDIRPGDRHVLSDGTRGTVLGVIDGWIAYTDRVAMVQHGAGVVRVEPVDPDDIPW